MAAQIGPFLKLKDLRFGDVGFRVRDLGLVQVVALVPSAAVWSGFGFEGGFASGGSYPTGNSGQLPAQQTWWTFGYGFYSQHRTSLVEKAQELGRPLIELVPPLVAQAPFPMQLRVHENGGETVTLSLGNCPSLMALWDMSYFDGLAFERWKLSLAHWPLPDSFPYADYFLPWGDLTDEAALTVNGVTDADRNAPAVPWRYGSSLFAQKRDYVLLCGQVLEVVEGTGPNALVLWTSRPAVQIDLETTVAARGTSPQLDVYGWLDTPQQSQVIDQWFAF